MKEFAWSSRQICHNFRETDREREKSNETKWEDSTKEINKQEKEGKKSNWMIYSMFE